MAVCVNGLSGRKDDQVRIFEVLEKGKSYGIRSGKYGGYEKTVTFSGFQNCCISSLQIYVSIIMQIIK